MGGGPGRDAALTPDLAETLAGVAAAMAAAHDDWWIIGSAAVALHGAAPVTVADVDVLCSERDARAVVARLGLGMVGGEADPLFRSAVFARWTGLPLAVEFMAGFRVRGAAVALTTRELVRVAGGVVAVPSREELRALLMSFGREKDLVRAALL